LNRRGHTIVLTTHYLEEAETLCSRVAMLKQGRIVTLDNIQNLINNISGFLVRFKLFPNVLPPQLNPLLNQRNDQYFFLKMKGYAELEDVMTTLRLAQTQILEMHVVRNDLQDIFVKITSNIKSHERIET